MTNLFQNHDGANAQAQATLAYLVGRGGIECSWKGEHGFQAIPKVYRWHNCREQGYVVTLRSKNYDRQINIAFFEHRNSDDIRAIKWEQITASGNPPTISDMDNKGLTYYVSKSFPYGKCTEMADWIYKQLSDFWEERSE